MKERKLLSMIDYTLASFNQSLSEYASKTYSYANFLNTKLELSMFVRYGKRGNQPIYKVLEYPQAKDFVYGERISIELYNLALKRYKEAEEKIFFKGFFVYNEDETSISIRDNESGVSFLYLKSMNEFSFNTWKIEQLSEFGLTLTQNAINIYKI